MSTPTARRRISLRRRDKNPDGRMPVMAHLRELRRRVIIMLLIVAVGAVVGWLLYVRILHFLEAPYCAVPARFRAVANSGGGPSCSLIYHSPLDGFTTRLKVSVIAGAVFTGPFWLYQIWGFVTPGLRKQERKYSIVFIALSTILFAGGMTLAYLVLAKGLKILIEQAGYGTQALLTITDYISFVTLMLVIFGAAFELPLLVAMANLAGVLPARILRKSQRVAIFLIFLFAAVATPSTDPFTMCAMALPMVVLFEAAVLFATVHDRRKARRKAAELSVEHLEDHVPSSVDPFPEALEAAPPRADWADTT